MFSFMAKKKEEQEVKVFSVFNSMQEKIREYTSEIHGEDAEELANKFATKIGGTVK